MPKGKNKKFLSVLLTLGMVVSLFAGVTISASAATMPSYTDSWTDYYADSANNNILVAYYDTSWYGGSGPFNLSSKEELAGLAAIVNGTAYVTNSSGQILNSSNATITDISNAELISQDSFSGETVNVTEDVDLNGHFWTPIGGSNDFSGTFNGGNKAISNLYINASGTDHIGLIGSNSGTVKNVHITSGYVIGRRNVGAVVGRNYGSVQDCVNGVSNSGTFSGCEVSANGSNQGAGGVVGSCWNTDNTTGTISDCTNYASVNGTYSSTFTGGVVGKAESTVTNCNNYGSVNGVGTSTGGVAGLAEGTVSGCNNYGAVTGTSTAANVGGVVGRATGKVSGCVNTATVTASSSTYAGGIVGYAENSVESCTNSGNVVGNTYAGGIAGRSESNVSSCTNSGTISGTTKGGISGYAMVLPSTCTTSGGTPDTLYGALYNASSGSGTISIISGGTVTLTGNADITISTDQDVTITSNGTAYNVSITYADGVNANLTINDLSVSAPYSSSKNIIDFAAGTTNVLTIAGTNLLENDRVSDSMAVIHVDNSSSLSIKDTVNTEGRTDTTNSPDTLYMYKNAMGCGIGGDLNEANGAITIKSGNLFIKGSRTGALIGNDYGTNTTLTRGNITIEGGFVNLVNKAQGAGIGGSRMSIAGDCYITGGNVTLVTDFSAPVIGAGAQKKDTQSNNGNLYVTGGSVKTMIMSNAYDSWGINSATATTYPVPGTNDTYVIDEQAITATKYSSGTTPVYLYTFDTGLATGNYEVYLDSATTPFFSGRLHQYVYSDITRKTTSGTYGTVDNWAYAADSTLYLYLTGANHTLSVNGARYNLTWNSTTNTWTTTPYDVVLDGTASTNGSGTHDSPFNSLTSAVSTANTTGGNIYVKGTVDISQDTTLNNSFIRERNYTGTLFSVATGKVLTLGSGASITGNETNTDVFLDNTNSSSDSYISLSVAVTNKLVVEMAHPCDSLIVAKASSSPIRNSTNGHITYVDSSAYTIGYSYLNFILKEVTP